jgi:hypothetical protein
LDLLSLNIGPSFIEHWSLFRWTLTILALNTGPCVIEHWTFFHWTLALLSLSTGPCFVEHWPFLHWTLALVSLNIVHYCINHGPCCSLNVHWMSTECSLNVHWMSTECSLSRAVWASEVPTLSQIKRQSASGRGMAWQKAWDNFCRYALIVRWFCYRHPCPLQMWGRCPAPPSHLPRKEEVRWPLPPSR